MGFAKYYEDDQSRLYNSTPVIARQQDRLKALASEQQKKLAPKIKSEPKKEKTPMNKMKDFTIAQPRPIPVIIIADVSGSMGENGKIEALNQSIKEMIKTFANEAKTRAEIQVGMITFGGNSARTHLPLAPASQILDVKPLEAAGATPMGSAFDLARELIEDKEKITSRAYKPVLILVSDGLPTDNWQDAFTALCNSDRAQKATRFALAIGSDADEDMLRKFANDVESPLFRAHEVRDIHKFFRAVTMSVGARTTSITPDVSAPLFLTGLANEDDLDLDF
jgi:uncharacterized protein YegL